MATNQLRSSTAAIALICATCFSTPVAHSQGLPSAPSPAQQAALDADPFFYGVNWVLSDAASVGQCSETAFMQCFENGYCATYAESTISRVYKLETAVDGGSALILRRPHMMESRALSPGLYGSNGLLIPETWSVPVATEHLNLELGLSPITASHTQASVGPNLFEDHEGQSYDAGLPGLLNFRACSPSPDFGWTEDMKSEAALRYETHEALRSVASYQGQILDTLADLETSAVNQALGVGLSSGELREFFAANCQACQDFLAAAQALDLGLQMIDEGPSDWVQVYDLVVGFDQDAPDLVDAIGTFVNTDFQAHVATLQAEIDALELAEARRQEEAEQERQAAADLALEVQEDRRAQVVRELEAFEQNPRLMLRYSYHNYMVAQVCSEARQGLAYQFITDNDLSRARDAIIGIEALLIEASTTLDTDAIWSDAANNFGDLSITPLPLIAELDDAMAAYVEVTQAQFIGGTGAQRRVHFESQVRNPNDLAQIEGICQLMGNALARDLVTLEAQFGAAEAPAKDF